MDAATLARSKVHRDRYLETAFRVSRVHVQLPDRDESVSWNSLPDHRVHWSVSSIRKAGQKRWLPASVRSCGKIKSTIREYKQLEKLKFHIKNKRTDTKFMEGFIGVHIGAGNHSSKLHLEYKRLCRRACRDAVVQLNQGKSAMDVAEKVTVILEDSPLTNAGFGSTLTWEGGVECDASIMDGSTLRWGGVGAVPNVKNPIVLARALCEKQGTTLSLGRIPPCLLVGTGAKKWAKQAGIEVVPRKQLMSERSIRLYRKYKRKIEIIEDGMGRAMTPLDTVGVVCLDKFGNISAGCSSGGIALKHPGRVGQAGTYGSGVWAENGQDSSIAVCTSGCGEHLMRTMLSKEIANDVKASVCPTSALHDSIKSKFLGSPMLNGISERLGGAAVLRVGGNGLGEFMWAHTTNTMCVGYMSTADKKPVSRMSSLPNGKVPGQNIVIEGTTFRARRGDDDDHFSELT